MKTKHILGLTAALMLGGTSLAYAEASRFRVAPLPT